MAHRRLRSDFDGKIAGLYDLEETIGEGHFAVVKLARHVFTGEKVAVKVIDKTKLDEVSKAHLFQEVRCMKLVQHPNVVRLYEVIDTQTKLYLILELGDGGDMYEYIMKHEKGLEESNARTYFRQIVEAISYCHRLHVVHRDLKLENVVLFKKLGIVKLTDFGFSNMFNPGKHLETSCGSLAYSAPEILLGDSYDAPAVDIWSLGVILYMLVGGKPPFQEANDSETLTMIMDCNYTFPKHISEECKQLISIMLKRDPGHRANLGEIEEHGWLKIGSNDISHHHMPLISREHVSEEIHTCVVEKMVEGSIASKEEILQSVEKDSYDHITATYYLLAERKLRKQHQEILNAAAMSHLRKHSAPSTKPHLEPLALSPRVKPRGLPDITALETPASGEDDQYGGVGIKEGQSKDDSNRTKPKGLMFSLLSPPGTHPSPSTSLGGSPTGTPGKGRKCSLIKEESVDEREEEEEEEEDMDFENYSDIRLAKSAENLDENYSKNASSPTKELDAEVSLLKRPLLSVASSPQLLNQICEENESEEEDDFVPPRINAPRMLTQRNSVASPEVIRKYEARKKRRGGSRGTSCSSSDASDTDDTEGRSRKDKLKHKFAHRRDSSDHSSDTDGGSNGHGGGGFGRGLGGGGSSGDGPSKDGDDKGGGGGKKGGGGGSPKNRHNGHHERGKHHNLSFKLGGELIPPRSMSGKSDKSVTSGLLNLSLASLSSKSSLKYVMERDEEVSDSDVEDNINEIEFMNKKNTNNNNTSNLIEQSDFSKLSDRARLELTYPVIPTCTLDCDLEKGKRLNKTVIKMDINSNSCKTEEKQLTQMKMETKCCSVI